MYSDFYNTTPLPTTGVDSTWLIISAVLAVVGGIGAYLFFVSKKKSSKYNAFVNWLHDFLNFKKYFINVVLKVMYIISAIFVTLGSFAYIGQSVASFFMMLILGNVMIRIVYEMILMLLTIVNNTSEINEKLGASKKESDKESNSKSKKKEE